MRGTLRRGVEAQPVGKGTGRAPDQDRHRPRPLGLRPLLRPHRRLRRGVSESAGHGDYLDILLLHRPDALVEPEEVARAFDLLESSGKVRAFGVSNHTPRQIDLLKTAVAQPLVANQVQLSITHASVVAQGLSSNMVGFDDSITRDGGGVVDYARVNKITLQAWSPFQKGFLDGVFLGSDDYPQLNTELDRLATRHGVEPIAIAVAWITRHPAGIQVVLGTTTPERVTAAAAGSDIPLTRGEWYGLLQAAGHNVP